MWSDEETILRRILRHEITWIVFILGSFWAAVTQIILPVRDLQIRQQQMAVTLTELKTTLSDIPNIKEHIAVMNEQLKNNILKDQIEHEKFLKK